MWDSVLISILYGWYYSVYIPEEYFNLRVEHVNREEDVGEGDDSDEKEESTVDGDGSTQRRFIYSHEQGSEADGSYLN